MISKAATFIGEVRAVVGAEVSIQLTGDLGTSLTLVAGESHRVGQIGSFLKIPLGYTFLYGVCTQIGAAAIPEALRDRETDDRRWVSLVLFGEALGGHFERGVSQYPTVADEVHLVTETDLRVIYGGLEGRASINVGTIASSAGMPGLLDLGKLLSRHCLITGSTGSGKSNLVAVILEAIATQGFPSARILVIDPHGEYGSSVGNNGSVFKVGSDSGDPELLVPFWALPFEEFRRICLGELSPPNETTIREMVAEAKTAASVFLASPPPPEAITADSPIPFSAHALWFRLIDEERRTYADKEKTTWSDPMISGNPMLLIPPVYAPPGAASKVPMKGPSRMLAKPLELFRNRLRDTRYSFLFSPGEMAPTLDGKITKDLDSLTASWVGNDRAITVLDVAGLPNEVVSAVVGTLLRVIYDTLFWASTTPVSGQNQPLLIVLEEAHVFLPRDKDSAAHRAVGRIAKEGRKYGVGLAVVTQRPTEIDPTVLSQCGTVIALRLTNASDRSTVTKTLPDDLGNLGAILPSLRTGEALVVGEAMPIPSRIRFRKAANKPVGDDADVASKWTNPDRPSAASYTTAISNWRRMSTAPVPDAPTTTTVQKEESENA